LGIVGDSMVDDEYELVPINPIRKMEKRLEKIEKTWTSTEMVKELISVVKTNQHIVDDIVKVNSEMISKVSELTNSVDKMTTKINEFMERLEAAEPVGSEGIVEERSTAVDTVGKRLDKMEKRINALILSTMSKKKIVPRSMQRPMPTHRRPGIFNK